MSTTILSLVMDVFVMVALGGAIYYTLKLSRSLSSFKSSREELKSIITDLARNIDEAHRAIEGLKKTSNVAADNLDAVLHDAKKMASEMKFINETSEGLANRLEKLAERNRLIAEGLSAAGQTYAEPDFPAQAYRPAGAAAVEAPSFMIQDRDLGADADEMFEEDDSGIQFSSQAEKDLYDALQKNKRKSGGGRS